MIPKGMTTRMAIVAIALAVLAGVCAGRSHSWWAYGSVAAAFVSGCAYMLFVALWDRDAQ